jgi:hypothetical protein
MARRYPSHPAKALQADGWRCNGVLATICPLRSELPAALVTQAGVNPKMRWNPSPSLPDSGGLRLPSASTPCAMPVRRKTAAQVSPRTCWRRNSSLGKVSDGEAVRDRPSWNSAGKLPAMRCKIRRIMGKVEKKRRPPHRPESENPFWFGSRPMIESQCLGPQSSPQQRIQCCPRASVNIVFSMDYWIGRAFETVRS